jgi:hypothetical protein
MADFPKVAAKVWEAMQGGSEQESEKLTAMLVEQKRLRSGLIKMRARGETTAEEFEQANGDVAIEICEIEEQLRAVARSGATADSFVRFAELQLMDIANAWQIAGPEQRRRVQNLLFDDGLTYSRDECFLNRSNSSLFSMLQTIKPQNGWLVGPPGLEPGTNGL